MLSLGFILAFIGAAIGMLIGMLIFSEVEHAIDCPDIDRIGHEECKNAKQTAWIVIGILPVALFFALLSIFGALSNGISLPSLKPKLKFETRKPKKIGLFSKIMITIGLAKAKRVDK